jgi:hypothetical protein
MSKCLVELGGVDWRLLSEQKLWLLAQPGDSAEGLIQFIDYIQDSASEQGQPVVWLTEEDIDVYD